MLDVDGSQRIECVSYKDGADEFRIYLDAKTSLPDADRHPRRRSSRRRHQLSAALRRLAQSRRRHDAVQLCATRSTAGHSKKNRSNPCATTWRSSPDRFQFPSRFATQKTDATPIASQWILRRVAGNVSYQDFGRAPNIEWTQARRRRAQRSPADRTPPSSIEMRDHLDRRRRTALRSAHRAGGEIDQRAFSRQTDSLRDSDSPPSRPLRRHSRIHGRGRDHGCARFPPRIFTTRVAKAPHTRQPDSLEQNRRRRGDRSLRRRPRGF